MFADNANAPAVTLTHIDSARDAKAAGFTQSLLRCGISLGFLALPAAVTAACWAHPALYPVISISFLLAVSAAAWWGGVWAGILASCAAGFVITAVATGGKVIIPSHFDPVGLLVFVFISVLVSMVANTRKRVEQVLRSANAQLEGRVNERTAELKHANSAIQHQFAELESLYADLPVGLCFLDKDLRFVRINQRLANINEVPVSDHLGRALREMISEGLADIVEPLYRRVLLSGDSILDFEVSDPNTLNMPHGRVWMIGCSPVRAERGAVLGLQVIVQDITDRKRSEYALRRAHAEVKSREEQFRTLANAIPQLSWMANGDGSILWCNDRWIDYTGTTLEQMQGLGWEAVHHPEVLPAVTAKWKACLVTGEPFEMEFPLRASNGCFRWFLTRIIPVRGDAGEVARWFGTATDIDELKRSREALLESEARFRAMADSAPVMIWVSATDKAFTWSNKPWLNFTGHTVDGELGRGWSHGIHPDDLERCVETYAGRFDARREFVIEYRRKRHDGEWRWVLEHGIPRVGGEGEFLGYIGSCVDIHDRKEMEQDLRRANGDLQQFAYSASHDLQEPIRTVAIYSQLIGKRYGSKLDGTGLTFLEYLITAAQRMEKLVQDLLLYTQTANTEASVSETTDAGEALNSAVANLSASVSEAGARITSDPLPAVKVRSVHLQQLFQNLVGNGIKYCGDQQPWVHVSAQEQRDHWLFSVKDNGIGIDPDYKERIFGIFKRLHTADKYSGTGIGLAICQRIVERYRGRIWVESEPGEGSTFFFTVPI